MILGMGLDGNAANGKTIGFVAVHILRVDVDWTIGQVIGVSGGRGRGTTPVSTIGSVLDVATIRATSAHKTKWVGI